MTSLFFHGQKIGSLEDDQAATTYAMTRAMTTPTALTPAHKFLYIHQVVLFWSAGVLLALIGKSRNDDPAK